MHIMIRMPKIKSVMTAFPFSISIGAPINEAIAFMREKQIRHLPVTDNRELVGVVSDRDIKLALGPDFAYPNPDELTVGEAMIRESYIVDLEERTDTVLEHMAEHHIGSAVVTRHGKLAGMFTTSDACREYANLLREQFRRAGGGNAA
jgi:acetoin utilization protein AcuB